MARTKSKSRSRRRVSCKKLTQRGCKWTIGKRKASSSQVRKRIGTKRMASIRQSARRRSLSRGVKYGRKQPVRKTAGPQCIISAQGRCQWYLGGKRTTLASLEKKFSSTKLAAAKKRARMGAIKKGIRVSSRSRTRKTTRKSKSPKRKTTKRTRSKSRSGGKKRKLPLALKLWGQAAREMGYMKRTADGEFKKLPKCDTQPYKQIKLRYEELKKKAGITKPTRKCVPK
jgi:hypothetical protein